MEAKEKQITYQDVYSATHFVVDVVICFRYGSVIKESAKELRNCIDKGRSHSRKFDALLGCIAK